MSTSKLLPSDDLPAPEPAPAPAPWAAIFLIIDRFMTALMFILMILAFGMGVIRWGDDLRLGCFMGAYLLMISLVMHLTVRLPRGSPALAWAVRGMWFAIAVAFVVCLYENHRYYCNVQG